MLLATTGILAEIPKPTDAPPALAPAEEAKAIEVPPGFHLELVASEPLITEPSGVCWDAEGRLYVCELHGYNLEGQLEIDELNKSGQLDTTVRRIQADERFKEAAKPGTYGVVKRLYDTDGDGLMDRADVLAADLPPVYGICPARGGLIVACAPDIVYLADRDGDGRAEVRETLFTGFPTGMLERGINAPQWGPDGWIYLGRGWGGGRITGPHLAEAVELPNTDFRVKPDGTAIEPVLGRTHTIGHALTPEGDRFVATTWKHSLYAAPIPWRYLARNPDAAYGDLEADAADYTTVFPLAPVHPWKLARSNQPGWKELYDRYGTSESAASGYFTSCCSPLVYQSSAFPADCRGNLFVCEPAQSLVHRAVIERHGPELSVHRAPGEERREFLASRDSWFRPVALAEAPDGALFIVDMYREIIEDYSAVPRFMQQQYGVNNGLDRGRLWRLAHDQAPSAKPADLSRLDDPALAAELESGSFWRRQTAERLLRERQGDEAPALAARSGSLADLSADTPTPRAVELLRNHDAVLATDNQALERVLHLAETSDDPRLLLQLALSLGESADARAAAALVSLARDHGHIRWLPAAILSGARGRDVALATSLLANLGPQGDAVLGPLSAAIAVRRNAAELESLLVSVAATPDQAAQIAALHGLLSSIEAMPLEPAAVAALERLLVSDNLAVKGLSARVAAALKLPNSPQVTELLAQAAADLTDPAAPATSRQAAVALVALSDDAADTLLTAWPSATPALRATLLDALASRGDRIAAVAAALEQGGLSASAFAAGHRSRLLEQADSHQRARLEKLFASSAPPSAEAALPKFQEALAGPRDADRGGPLFEKHCAVCHRVKNKGGVVGPELSQAFQRAEVTLLRDILAPSEKLSSGYDAYVAATADGQQFSGVLAGESATSVTLRLADGTEKTLLRKDLESLVGAGVSLMPDGFAEALSPQDCADLLAWIKRALAE
ncbi:MAG: PVC-type heme-binding CxxCH protein [Pirellulales bacterium]